MYSHAPLSQEAIGKCAPQKQRRKHGIQEVGNQHTGRRQRELEDKEGPRNSQGHSCADLDRNQCRDEQHVGSGGRKKEKDGRDGRMDRILIVGQ